MSTEDQEATEGDRQCAVAWDLYRAWRTYPEARESINNARQDYGIRPYGNRGGIADILYGFAEFVALKHGFATAALANALSIVGIDIIVTSIAFEIERLGSLTMPSPETEAYLLRTREGFSLLGSAKPLWYGFDDTYRKQYHENASVLVHPSAYRDKAAFLAAMARDLPWIYDDLVPTWQKTGLFVRPEGDKNTREGSVSFGTLAPTARAWALYRVEHRTLTQSAAEVANEYQLDNFDVSFASKAIRGLENRHRVTRKGTAT